MLVLYDLAGADAACRFSPYCWRITMALAHKGLAFESVPVRFTDKPLIAFSGQDKVPVLRDGAMVVADSWAIAAYLEEAYPRAPSLFGGAARLAQTNFIRHWCERVVHGALLPLILLDIAQRLAPADQAYFRKSREARFGRSLEAFVADAGDAKATLGKALSPLRATLAEQPFLTGMAPGFADYIVFGPLQWARVTSPRDVLEGDAVVTAWRTRMLDLFDGLARRTPAAGPGA